MTIASPQYLLLLLFIPLVILAALRNFRRGRRSLMALTGRAPGDSFYGLHQVVSFFSTAFFCGFIFFASLASADFSWGRKPLEEDRAGLDLIFLLDVSRSMLAADAPPNRLQAAVDTARGLMQGLPEARFGVVAFKGRGVPVVPVTEDHGALESFFEYARSSVVAEPGTNLSSGLETAIRTFPAGTERHKALVLLSDGESQGPFRRSAAAPYGEEGIPIFSVGFGNPEGSTIKLSDGSLLLGRNKKPVISRLEERSLRAATDLSGGTYFTGDDPAIVTKLIEEIQSFVRSRGLTGFRLISASRFRGFLFLALASLLGSILVRSVRWKRKE